MLLVAAGDRSSFSLISVEEVQSCPFAPVSACERWPAAQDGTVRLYTSDELFGSHTYRRSFYVFIPANVSQPAPLVMYLHGGYGSGLLSFKQYPFHGWAAGHQRIWKRNTLSCKMTWDPARPLKKEFKTVSGSDCDPDNLTTEAPTNFVIVYPSGLQDRRVCSKTKLPCDANSDCAGLTNRCSGRSPTDASSTASRCHWEDGRSPSPSWGLGTWTDATQYRDDVGFVNHILDTLLTAAGTMPAVNRIVVGGTSNGGMMTHRVGCHVGDPVYSALGNISALMINVAAMPYNVFDGRLGRQQCMPRRPLRVIYTVGKGLATPDCKEYGCEQPTVDGDGHIPFGTPGQVHNVNSPSLGAVVSNQESMQRWMQTNARLTGRADPPTTTKKVGVFTTKMTMSLGADLSYSDVVGYVTDGGSHILNADRGDIDVFETMLKFALEINAIQKGEVVVSDDGTTTGQVDHASACGASAIATGAVGLVVLAVAAMF